MKKITLLLLHVFICISPHLLGDCLKINEFIKKHQSFFQEIGAKNVKFKCIQDNGADKLLIYGKVVSQEELEILKAMMNNPNFIPREDFEVMWSVKVEGGNLEKEQRDGASVTDHTDTGGSGSARDY